MDDVVRVATVEDEPGIREGLRFFLEHTPGFTCAGCFESVEEALPTLTPAHVDIVLMDLALPGMSGIEGIRQYTPSPRRAPQPDIVPTLEVMQGGRTLFTHPALVKLFNPQPDPPGARKTPGIFETGVTRATVCVKSTGQMRMSPSGAAGCGPSEQPVRWVVDGEVTNVSVGGQVPIRVNGSTQRGVFGIGQ